MNEAKKTGILTAARSVFLRHGFRRVSMQDIAQAAGVSRAALYLLFNGKEEVFVGVFLQWVDETIAAIETAIRSMSSPREKLLHAFELWAVAPFDLVAGSPEAKELVEFSFEFGQDFLRQGYRRFELTIAPVLASMDNRQMTAGDLRPERIAHLLTSAVRGFKQVATSPAELRHMIEELLTLSLGSTVVA